MNPWGAVMILLGILLIVVGIKGSQSKVLEAFKGTKAA